MTSLQGFDRILKIQTQYAFYYIMHLVEIGSQDIFWELFWILKSPICINGLLFSSFVIFKGNSSKYTNITSLDWTEGHTEFYFSVCSQMPIVSCREMWFSAICSSIHHLSRVLSKPISPKKLFSPLKVSKSLTELYLS